MRSSHVSSVSTLPCPALTVQSVHTSEGIGVEPRKN